MIDSSNPIDSLFLQDTTVLAQDAVPHMSEPDTLLLQHSNTNLPLHNDSVASSIEVSIPQLELPEIERLSLGMKWPIFIVLIVLLLVAFLRTNFKELLKHTWQSVLKQIATNRKYIERGSHSAIGNATLDIIFVLNISVLLYFVLSSSITLKQEWLKYIVLLAITIVFLLFKTILYKAVGSIIHAQELAREHVFNVATTNRVLGLILLPLSLILAFPHMESKFILYILSGLVLLIGYIALILRTIRILIPTGVSIFYLILYLCTLEIIPLLYVYKLITEYL